MAAVQLALVVVAVALVVLSISFVGMYLLNKSVDQNGG
jgi:uncharacterized protein YoxC